VLLFFSSYSPLFIILAVRNLGHSVTGSEILLGISIISLLGLAMFLRAANQLAPHNVTVTRVVSRDAEAMAYIVTYLIPFLGISLSDPTDAVSLGIMFGLIAVLYVRTDLIYINPILSLLGYRLFEVETEGGKTSALVCKRDYVKTGSLIAIVSLDDYVLLEKKE